MDVTSLANSLSKYLEIIFRLENNTDLHKESNSKLPKTSTKNDPVFMSQNLKCEPYLGKRDLYHKLGALTNQDSLDLKKSIQWMINFSDGYHSLFDISKKSGISLKKLNSAVIILKNADLIKEQ